MYLAVGVKWCPHAWLQQSQCKSLKHIQVVSHLITHGCCTVDDILEDIQA